MQRYAPRRRRRRRKLAVMQPRQLLGTVQALAAKVTRPPMALHLTAFWGFSLPLGYVLGIAPDWAPWRPDQPMQATGFWLALVLGLTIAGIGLTWMLRLISEQHCAQATEPLAT
jgi:Na+-driven multidrug efflux pump